MAGTVLMSRSLCLGYGRKLAAGAPVAALCCCTVRQPRAVLPLCLSWATPPGRSVHCSSVRFAGHNKWSKVKNIKGPKDAARSRMFMKFALMIRLAVREGGANPDFNAQLANIIEQCRSKNMPKASIEAAVKGADKSKASSYALYEGRGPGSSSLLIEILTDNNARSHREIKHILAKNGGTMCDGARYSFQRKGVVTASGQDAAGRVVSLERALELAIESGAEDVRETEDEEEKPLLQFICDVSSLRGVRQALDSLGLRTLAAGPEFVACSLAQLSQGEMESASRLLEVLNECPDVIRVWDNIQGEA
nr:PREDICTED: translational activator of cytochrome c oxidase 1 [Lepisosteus oculatus]XP_015217343.1 PREDICTED: translational activator of cytochrome c oxidase 1 [Lepisosteus oculatus]